MDSTFMSRFVVLGAVAASSVMTVAGCPGSLDDASRFAGPGAFVCNTSDIEQQFHSRCSEDSPCHSSADMQGMLDLEASNIAGRVNGVPADSTCGPDLLADPNNPADSVLVNVLRSDSCSPFGQMPQNGTPYSAAEVACVEQWISEMTPMGTGGSPPMGGMGGTGGATGGMGGMGGATGGGGMGGN